MTSPAIREGTPGDRAEIFALYPRAFPDEDLLPLLRTLLDEIGVLSLVAIAEGRLAGHVAFTECGISDGERKLALLGPVAVAPERQRQGIGGALIREGLDRLAGRGVSRVFVLGDPAYYGRFGFRPERRVQPPYPLPEEWRDAWQSQPLGEEKPAPAGTLVVPPCWRDPALWSD